MSYYCDNCNKTMNHKSKNKQFKTLTHRELDKCKHMKLTILNLDINKIDIFVYEYIIEHSKQIHYYLKNCDFEVVFNNSDYSPHTTSKFFDKKTMISWG